jgi:site-specific DNA recombinase
MKRQIPHSPKTAFIYLRVSPRPDEQQSVSIEAQEAKCRDHAERLGLPVELTFKDEFISGKDGVEHRSGLAALLKAHRANPNAVVIVYSVSRLARRQSLLWHLLDEQTGEGLRISSATEPFDTASPIGRAMLGMLGVWAQLEADMISERTRDGLAVVRSRGTQLGQKSLVQLNPEAVQQAKDLHTAGLSMQRIADELNRRGVKSPGGGKWAKSNVYKCIHAKIDPVS